MVFEEDSNKMARYVFEDRQKRISLIDRVIAANPANRSALISDITFMPMSEINERLPRA